MTTYHTSWKPRPLRGLTPNEKLATVTPLEPVPEDELAMDVRGVRETGKGRAHTDGHPDR